ncbi:MAG: bifunctional UDP-N-acetylglucosamine diphosphorylase/glucosamine-1-phosphate N-acetyltransferase GlmU [Tissierellia bacterium]|nr:bifunctional UDP-N-acetylglucosamine diphosphorylase/glucosamine-1-phosphate N-acetyltransferase GlmU [Tissierellia bacterium]
MNIGIVLAAGEGTRMKSKKPKVVHSICGKPLIFYVLDAASKAGVDKNVIIIGHGKEEVVDCVKGEKVHFAEQPTYDGAPYGTGFAVMQAIDYINDDDNVVILCGDTPLIESTTIKKLMNFHKNENNHATVLTAKLENPSGYGRIIKNKLNEIEKIVEQKDATEEEKSINEINSGFYCFRGRELKLGLEKITNDNLQNEYYLTDVIEVLSNEGYNVKALAFNDPSQLHGINSRDQLAKAEGIMRNKINKEHMINGVSFINPESTYIDPSVKIGKDTIIYPNVYLEKDTVIGEDCIIRSNSRIVDSVIENNVEIEASLIESSFVGKNCHIGPFAHLRPAVKLGNNVKIGNFVEVKKSTIKDNSKASHLAYIGDADIGESVNIGCGVIFVNYNGQIKSRSVIHDNAFIGSNSNIVAPVEVAKWGYVAAGSTITKDVGEGDLSIERAQQVNIPGWVERKGLKKDK